MRKCGNDTEEFPDTASELIRVGITTPKEPEQERVITLYPTLTEQATEIKNAIEGFLIPLALMENLNFAPPL